MDVNENDTAAAQTGQDGGAGRDRSQGTLLHHLFALLFFAGVFLFFTNPLNAITDFWWHISSGRWIWQNGALPAFDPFSTGAALEPDTQRAILLKGYWLAQTSYYLVYEWFGWAGVVCYKALVLTLIFFALWRVLLSRGIDRFAALLLVSPLLLLVKPFEFMRPQIFTFLLFLLLFHVIELFLKELRREDGGSTRVSLFLPVIMVLWANLHPLYLIGIAMIGVYAFSETAKYLSRRNALSAAAFRRLLLWLGIAAAASCLNPNHVQPVISSLTLFGAATSLSVDEYARTWTYYSETRNLTGLYLYLTVSCVTLLVLLFSWRRVQLSHILLFGGLAAAGMAVFRFSIFFTLLSVAIAGGYAAEPMRRIAGRLRMLSAGAAVCVLLALLNYSAKSSFLAGGAPYRDVPEAAAQFVLRNNLPGPVFHPYEWGGYLMWQLYPRYRVFIDGRVIDPARYSEYLTANYGRKDEVFARYGINTVIFYIMNVRRNGVPDVVFSLLKDDAWKIVYLDDQNAVIFVRSAAAPFMPSIAKKDLTDALIGKALAWAARFPDSGKAYLMLGQLYRVQGDRANAEKYFREVLRVDPGNVFASSWLRQ